MVVRYKPSLVSFIFALVHGAICMQDRSRWQRDPSAIECIFTYLIIEHMYSRVEEKTYRLHPVDHSSRYLYGLYNETMMMF
jgi:hypothetical protein